MLYTYIYIYNNENSGKKKCGAVNNVRSGNEPTLSCKEQMVDSALKAGSLTGGGGYTAASTERIHAATPEGSFLRVGVIKSQSNRGEKAAGLKKEPNVAIFLPGVTALCLETRVARS